METFILEISREQAAFLVDRLQGRYSDQNLQGMFLDIEQALLTALQYTGREVSDHYHVPRCRNTPLHPAAQNLLIQLRLVDQILRKSSVGASRDVVERWDELLKIGPFRRDFEQWRDAGYPYGEEELPSEPPPEGRLQLLMEEE